jgi:hypothetical protein
VLARTTSPSSWRHSRAVCCSTEFYERRSNERIGLSISIHVSSFLMGLDGFPSTSSLGLSQVQVHPLMSVALLQSTYSLVTRRSHRDRLPPWVPLPFAISIRGVHSQRVSTLASRSTLSVSHALDGFLLHIPCQLVSSRYRVRDFTSGVFPGIEPSRLSTTSYPLVVIAAFLLPSELASASSQLLAFRVLISISIRCH